MHPRSVDSDLSESAVQNHSVGVTSDASEATSNEKSGEPLDNHRELKHEIQRLYQLLEVQNKDAQLAALGQQLQASVAKAVSQKDDQLSSKQIQVTR